jgi:hypothetical protein
MAMHTQNLQACARASFLVTQEDSHGEPLGASRVTLVGNVYPVPDTGSAEVRKLARRLVIIVKRTGPGTGVCASAPG